MIAAVYLPATTLPGRFTTRVGFQVTVLGWALVVVAEKAVRWLVSGCALASDGWPGVTTDSCPVAFLTGPDQYRTCPCGMEYCEGPLPVTKGLPVTVAVQLPAWVLVTVTDAICPLIKVLVSGYVPRSTAPGALMVRAA
ncbi:hypothetical protein I6A84_37910 [Frankia sp. CNm7]|uniref:Uncharacterized protein n=1 Tax=Frankia nepalensis TaxID=1836974 RepID=A0A937RJW1_9ACTN|nr:hypothetical protein [Frankia nepalensis]MBL7501889.1 hypothetical protein [Frankia nepalensis]MBL7511630.1 hypothetical protein [Frankia nepalensis]MBL7523664.1 hypothetical protein [Frankia nepalensis]MBL7633621.1 hypothetical protein [Frankia nepalensis]